MVWSNFTLTIALWLVYYFHGILLHCKYRCLTNIAAGDHAHAGEVLHAVPNIIQVLANENCSPTLREQVCWTVGNIAGDCDDYRQVLLANGCLPSLLRFLVQCSTPGQEYVHGARTAAWALSNIARGSTPGSVFVVAGTVLATFARCLTYVDKLQFVHIACCSCRAGVAAVELGRRSGRGAELAVRLPDRQGGRVGPGVPASWTGRSAGGSAVLGGPSVCQHGPTGAMLRQPHQRYALLLVVLH
jgi:hypothetical protein